jgi:alkane 1-monooxygenase
MTAVPSRPLPLAAFALAALVPLPLLVAGVFEGGAWLWAAFLYLALGSMLMDEVLPESTARGDEAQDPAADLILVSVALGALAILPLATWALAGPGPLDTGERVLLFFATGFWLGQVAHPAAHELIHRPRRELFRLGAAVYTAILFGQHASAHRLVHHRFVASPEDPNTARAGEGFYRFALRAWIGSFRTGLRAESDLRARGQWQGPHPYAGYIGGGLGALLLAGLIAGLPGVLAWAGLALHAQGQILLSDYVQHYGLLRARGPDGRLEPVQARHSWNAAHWFTSAMMLNAPRHSDHHVHPGRPFPALAAAPADEAPRLPWPLPVACALALVPKLWRRAIRPHLAQWHPARAQDTRA